MASSDGKRSFGQVSRLASGRYQARYVGPDGRRHPAPTTFEDRDTAVLWLRRERTLTEDPESWLPPKERLAVSRAKRLTFGEFAAAWLDSRTVKGQPLAARTREHYANLLERHILPRFGDVPLDRITPDSVDAWYALAAIGKPTMRSHAYSLLRTILGTAVDRGLITTANPAKVRGGGSTRPVKRVRPATLAELEALTAAMPERLRLMVLLASWTALRFGELAELRRGDIDTKRGVVRVRRGVVRAAGEVLVKTPKSDAGSRDVAIPPHLMPMVREHLLRHTQPGARGLLFPAASGGHLQPSTLYGHFYKAREAAGRTDLRFHDLRHTGAVLAAQTGATLAELMARLGHSTPAAALRYQHAAADRDAEIARKLSQMADGER